MKLESPIYADFNATTPPGIPAIEAMKRAFEIWGNASSSHKLGRESAQMLDEARRSVAALAGCEPTDLVFTSGGSEANNLAIMGSYYSLPPGSEFRLITSTVEHSSVRDLATFLQTRGAKVLRLRPLPTGELDLAALEKALDEFKPHLASFMTANNETGVVFPIPDIAKLCAARGIPLHTDAVQALGKLPSRHWADATLISISAHKVHGPKGTGALIVRNQHKLVPIQYGGSQEIKRRGGTEGLIGIAGFGAACAHPATETELSHLAGLRDRFEKALIAGAEGIRINGGTAPRLPNTSNVRFEGVASEVLLGALDLDGVYVSAGSACSSGSISPSHVLLEMGLTRDEAKQCLRFSWGRETTGQDVDTAAQLVLNHVTRIRRRKLGRLT